VQGLSLPMPLIQVHCTLVPACCMGNLHASETKMATHQWQCSVQVDEHYFSTLLAMQRRDQETDCKGGLVGCT
jgi:hypothetical protein